MLIFSFRKQNCLVLVIPVVSGFPGHKTLTGDSSGLVY